MGRGVHIVLQGDWCGGVAYGMRWEGVCQRKTNPDYCLDGIPKKIPADIK